MPIHRINLPLTPTPSFSVDQSLQEPPNVGKNTTSDLLIRNLSSKQLFTPSMSNNSADEGLQKKGSNTNSLSSKSAAQSSTSLLSMLSNQTATTEYSPSLIDKECGDLLKIIDLDITSTDNEDNNNDDTICSATEISPKRCTRHEKVSFDLSGVSSETDTDTDTDADTDSEEIGDASSLSKKNGNLRKAAPQMRREDTSNDLCGCSDKSNTENGRTRLDYTDSSQWDYREKWIFVLIGLPACGKSTMIKDFQDFVLRQTSSKVRVKSYNAGDVRRKYEAQCHNKFNFNDIKSSRALRNTYALEALNNLATDLVKDNIDIGILDATNTTRDRRNSVFNYIKAFSKSHKVVINPLLFEIKCSNRALRRFNIEQKSKNKDYIHVNREVAINDFLERIRNYERSYEKVTVEEIKHLNVKYFGIDNVGDSIYYDCGLKHHNNSRHENLLFKSIALNLLYEFLIHYRTNYASQYLTDIDEFYTCHHYHPIKTTFSRPVSIEEVKKVSKASVADTNPNSPSKDTQETLQLPKVLSSSRINVGY